MRKSHRKRKKRKDEGDNKVRRDNRCKRGKKGVWGVIINVSRERKKYNFRREDRHRFRTKI
jgi:hypothetical protein